MKQMAESDKVSFKTLSKIPKVEPPADLTRLPATLEPVAGCQKLSIVLRQFKFWHKLRILLLRQYKLKLKSKLMPTVNVAMSLTACQEGTPLEAVKFV